MVYNDDRDRPVPEVKSFDSATVTNDEVVKALSEAGGCVLKNLLSADILAQIEKDVREHLDADKPWDGTFFPIQTRRVNGLASKSKVFMEELVNHKILQECSKTMLSSTLKYWIGDTLETSVSNPQLNNTIVFSIGPGAKDQPLHRDDIVHHRNVERKEAADYKIGQDSAIGFFVGGKKTTKANGATRFIPGSHLWDSATPPSEDLAAYAELEAGDAFIMLASCYHGGSANTTTDEERLVYSCFMTKGYLRQVLFSFLSVTTI